MVKPVWGNDHGDGFPRSRGSGESISREQKNVRPPGPELPALLELATIQKTKLFLLHGYANDAGQVTAIK
jgi:hypothetical protein